MGLEPEGQAMFNVSSAEGPKWAAICKEMSDRAHRLSPSPVKREARAAWLAARYGAGAITWKPVDRYTGEAGKKRQGEVHCLPVWPPAAALRLLSSRALPSGRINHYTRFPQGIYHKELDTRKKLRHEREHLTHHHYWKKQDLLRTAALYPQLRVLPKWFDNQTISAIW
jgi:hypothetical protein